MVKGLGVLKDSKEAMAVPTEAERRGHEEPRTITTCFACGQMKHTCANLGKPVNSTCRYALTQYRSDRLTKNTKRYENKQSRGHCFLCNDINGHGYLLLL